MQREPSASDPGDLIPSRYFIVTAFWTVHFLDVCEFGQMVSPVFPKSE